MAVRTIACLPAVTGAWRHAGRRPAAVHLRDLPRGQRGAGAARPDPARHAHAQHEPARPHPARRRAAARRSRRSSSTTPTRPRWRPSRSRCAQGLRREDLFTVVHELFQTDTVDFADIVLPATTTLEHYDIHKAYGHLYVSAEPARHRAAGREQCRTPRSSACWPRAWGSTIPACSESDEEMARAGAATGATRTWRASTSSGWSARLACACSVPDPFAPFAEGGFPTPRASASSTPRRWPRRGWIRCPRYVPPRESVLTAPGAGAALSAGLHLAAGAPLPELDLLRPAGLRAARERADPHPASRRRGGARASRDGQPVRTFNDRGSFLATRAGLRRGAAGRGGGPLDLVGEDVPGRPQRERGDQPGAHRPGRRRDLLRRAG